METGPRSDTEGSVALTEGDTTVSSVMRRELPPGERVGRYRIVRLLGRGGMGSVFHAERGDDQYQQSVALKNLAMGNHSAAESDLRSSIASLREQDEPGRLAEALCVLADLRKCSRQHRSSA